MGQDDIPENNFINKCYRFGIFMLTHNLPNKIQALPSNLHQQN